MAGGPVALADSATAFGQYGNGGWAWGTGGNKSDMDVARSVALTNCNAHGQNCKVLTTFRGTCFALAVQSQRGHNAYGWATNQELSSAEQNALSYCRKYQRSCAVQVSFCDVEAAAPAPSPPPSSTPSAPTPTPTVERPPQPEPGGSACQRFPNLC